MKGVVNEGHVALLHESRRRWSHSGHTSRQRALLTKQGACTHLLMVYSYKIDTQILDFPKPRCDPLENVCGPRVYAHTIPFNKFNSYVLVFKNSLPLGANSSLSEKSQF